MTAAPRELDEWWLTLLYQVPVGLLVCDDDGVVELVNPAAARMLAPAMLPGFDLATVIPLLEQIAPDLVDVITRDRGRLGRLDTGRRVVTPAGDGRSQWCELIVSRIDVGRVLVTLLDVTAERRLADREHQIAVELQGAMLGRIDAVPGLPVGVVYRAAAEQMAIGGDWYDVIDLGDDRVALVVGDVCGHNLAATAVMGQLRSAMRAIAASCNGPAEVLDRVSRFASGIEGAECSTAACVFLDRGRGTVTYSCAGQLPPLLLRAGAAPRLLEGGRHPPLAVPTAQRPVEAEEALRPGDLVVLYTDGLIERRDEDLDVGLARLCRAAAELDVREPAEFGTQLAAALLGADPPADDVCVLTIRHETDGAAGQSNVTVDVTPARSAGPPAGRSPRP